MANLMQWGIGVYSLLTNNKTSNESWDFRDKQGTSIFGNVRVMDIGVEKNGSTVAQPIEENSFFSYNKTSEPTQITCTLCFEGTAQYMQSCLNIVDRYRIGIDLVSIVTPHAEYENMTLESYSYTRDVTNGQGLLYVQTVFREVKEVKAAYSSTDVSELPPPISEGESANPSDASTQDTGMNASNGGTSQQQESAKRSRSVLKDISDWGSSGGNNRVYKTGGGF